MHLQDQNGKQLSNIFDSTSRTNVDTPQNLCLLIQLLLGVDMSDSGQFTVLVLIVQATPGKYGQNQ